MPVRVTPLCESESCIEEAGAGHHAIDQAEPCALHRVEDPTAQD
jgi:hypothetical protein